MTYTLYIGNKRYSSWSMRPWILLKALNIPFVENVNFFKDGPTQPHFFAFSPTGKVPCLHDNDDDDDNDESGSRVIWDSFSITEYVAESHAGVWPVDATARAWARSAAAEMHSGFFALREECYLNVALRIQLGTPSEPLQRDINRLDALFRDGIERFGGPWLAGREFTAVDAFFAPVASRCKTFGVRLGSEAARGYVDRLFAHPAVQEWVEGGSLRRGGWRV
ncbi:hypothetical protein PT974_05518 [Cladobotryum mycophilum]|uniref:GST N-terminal domain-containing protein n=1 Tax=Cladobotryum mycophilum TaxID=491253 RepID=A0ABR0SK32_9HYPO